MICNIGNQVAWAINRATWFIPCTWDEPNHNKWCALNFLKTIYFIIRSCSCTSSVTLLVFFYILRSASDQYIIKLPISQFIPTVEFVEAHVDVAFCIQIYIYPKTEEERSFFCRLFLESFSQAGSRTKLSIMFRPER